MSDEAPDTLWVVKIQRDKDTQITKGVKIDVMKVEDIFPGPYRDREMEGARAGKKGYTTYWGVTRIEAIHYYVEDKRRLAEQAAKMADRASQELDTALKVRQEYGTTGK